MFVTDHLSLALLFPLDVFALSNTSLAHVTNSPLPCDRVLLLLLSSGYIGLRIVALEEQLTSLGALSDFTLHSG